MKRLAQFLLGTLRGRLILAVAAVHAAMMTLFIVDLTKRQKEMILDRQVDEAVALSDALATSAAEWIAAKDLAGLRELVEAQQRYPELLFAILADDDGRVLAALGNGAPGDFMLDLPALRQQKVLSRTPAMVDVATPAMLGNRHVGWARVGIGQRLVSQRLSCIAWTGANYALFAILLGSIIAWYTGRRISRRLYAVQETIAAVRAGNKHARSTLKGSDEASAMSHEFNAMLDALAEHDSARRSTEEKYRSLIQKVQVAVVVHDNKGVALDSNPLAEQTLGITKYELLGKDLTDPTWRLLREDGSPLPRSEYPASQVLSTGQALHSQVFGLCRNSTAAVTWVLASAEPVFDHDGAVERVIVSFVDINQRRLAEVELHQLNRELRAIRKCSQIMIRADDESTLLSEICRIICEDAGYLLAWVGYLQRDTMCSVHPVAWAGHDHAYIEKVQLSWSPESERGRGPGGEAIRTGKMTYVQDLSTDPRMALWRDEALQQGYRSLVALPLKDEANRPFGALMIYSSTVAAFTPAEQQLLEELAADLAFGITSLRMRAARKVADRVLHEAQEVFRSLVENSPDIIARYGRDGARTYVNPTYLKVSQLPQSELIGSAPMRYSPLPNDSATLLQGLLQRVLSTGVAETIDLPWPHASGVPSWYNIYAFPELDRDGSVASVMTISRDISERKNAEAALAESEERYRTIFEHSPLGIFRSTLRGKLIEVNPALADMLGYASPDEVVSRGCSIFEQVIQDASSGATARHLNKYQRRNGEEFLANLYLTAVHGSNGTLGFLEGIVEDVTETHVLEAQLRQAQKIEAVGRLAGGVAHDFNNMLGVILGHTELALDEPGLPPSLQATLHEIRAAAERSATLTRQLLAFARKQTVAPRLLDLNTTVAGMISMLRRLIGEDVVLKWIPMAEPCMVEMDPAQVDQIMANLCVNARDAISGVGVIIIETATVTEDGSHSKGHLEVFPGRYIQLSVSDNGCGMSRETVSRLFEPFFTTKEPGKGTGLGLATVYGIVKQNQGFLNVYSEPGRGTTFKVYLPAKQQEDEKMEKESLASPQSGRETVLLVEDEPAILRMATQLLQRLGYHVLPAPTPSEALHIARSHKGVIDLLITDVVMPEMNGRQLCDQLSDIVPGLRALFMSGYTNNVIAHHGVIDEGIQFIAKPFSMTEFAKKIRTILDGPEARS
jgi:PAS domain S-box-containing protein